MTAQDASEPQIKAHRNAVYSDCVIGVIRTGRRKTAGLWKYRRDQELVCSNQTQSYRPDHQLFSCLQKMVENSLRRSPGESFSAPGRAIAMMSFPGCGICPLFSLNHSRMTLLMRFRLTAGQNRFCTIRPNRWYSKPFGMKFRPK